MDGVLDPNETAGIAMQELAKAAQLVDEAAGHARAALNKAARLYVEAESATMAEDANAKQRAILSL